MAPDERTRPPLRTSRLQRWIPWSLVVLRLFLAPVSLGLVFMNAPRWLWLFQFFVAILSDIYDGNLARRWGVASSKLRRADSITDDVYAFACLACFWLAEPEIVADHIVGISIVVALDLARTPFDWFLFGKRASYHSWSARSFGLSLIPVGVLIMGFGEVYWVLWASLFIGFLAEIEGIAMSLLLPKWTHDVKHIGRALAIRREHYGSSNHLG